MGVVTCVAQLASSLFFLILEKSDENKSTLSPNLGLGSMPTTFRFNVVNRFTIYAFYNICTWHYSVFEVRERVLLIKKRRITPGQSVS